MWFQVDAFIKDVESLEDSGEPAPLPRTASGTPTIPPPSDAAAFRVSLRNCTPEQAVMLERAAVQKSPAAVPRKSRAARMAWKSVKVHA